MALLYSNEFINENGQKVVFEKYGYINENGEEVLVGTSKTVSPLDDNGNEFDEERTELDVNNTKLDKIQATLDYLAMMAE